MIGWMVLFALMAVCGAGAALSGVVTTVSATTASIIFTALFVLSILTRAVRSRAR